MKVANAMTAKPDQSHHARNWACWVKMLKKSTDNRLMVVSATDSENLSDVVVISPITDPALMCCHWSNSSEISY